MKEQIYNRLQIEREGRRRAIADAVHTPLLCSSPARGATRDSISPCSLMQAPTAVKEAWLSLGCHSPWEAREGKRLDVY